MYCEMYCTDIKLAYHKVYNSEAYVNETNLYSWATISKSSYQDNFSKPIINSLIKFSILLRFLKASL